ncbi:LytR/AlgR family response regulator transcription factor [Dyadobacter chenhuakuii]|uniref:LytTR family DNA-binding domain-containing protein n=1 Tax=Dyadobacter chenhuakuii TaxID=2909339 RepID=A0ABY4XSM6_9BACT|nr:LytTR family DNA-binding domain-containing protein [Dyadobacter chenhuakuii]MCF2492395.1 LytTR family DNA-binding domain-containing protein [Dyadobacter chenhuakuii]USJ33303.1 LytTR family DNA-binding domain-containing protein [Dyadobacter chenhuakuii]
MKVLIIEDEGQTAERLENLIHRYDKTIRVLDKIGSVEKTLAYFAKQNAELPDLIFMDIHLEDDLGFRILEELKLTVPVIFTTAFNEYALRAFKTFSIDYLLKPIDYQELSEAIDKFKTIVKPTLPENRFARLLENYKESAYKERFMVTAGTRLQSIAVAQVAYFSYERKTTLLNTTDGKFYSLDYSLDKLVELLDPNRFFRVNRSQVISLHSIRSVNQHPMGKMVVEIEPTPRVEVTVSLDRIAAFKDWLGK